MNEQPTIDILVENDDKQLDLLLQLTNSYIDLQAQVSQQKRIISMQGSLINQCMERIMSLEGRCVLGNFNQRLETLEANKGKMYELSHTEVGKMLKSLVKRVDALESYLYTHDYQYFQEQEENQSGNSSFEEHEMRQQSIADNAQLEETGTHPPDCRCEWCDPRLSMEG